MVDRDFPFWVRRRDDALPSRMMSQNVPQIGTPHRYRGVRIGMELFFLPEFDEGHNRVANSTAMKNNSAAQ